MKVIEAKLWHKYYSLQHEYQQYKEVLSKEALERLEDEIELALEDLQDLDVNVYPKIKEML